MSDLLDFESLKLTIASSEQTRAWSFGEVTKPETINYRTLKPEKDGLFAENIFGPTKDYECYCGKYKRIRYRGVICDKCGVEVTQSKVRRERMGHITLAASVAHNWFVKGAPSKLSLVLDMSLKALEAVIYFASYLTTSIDPGGQAKAVEKLEKDLLAKKEEVRQNIEKNIAILESDLRRQLVELKQKTKAKEGEKYDLEAQELELKVKQEIQKQRDNLAVEQGQLEQIFKAVTDLVKSITFLRVLSEDEYIKLDEYGVADFLEVGMGAEGLLQVLRNIDLDKLSAQLRNEVQKTSGQRHIKATKRLRVIEGMRSADIAPEWMILKILPVIPPDLRPMVQLPGGRFATSDLNDLYRRVINRNNRLKRLIDLGAPEIILRNEKRMLQEAVDALIDSSIRTSRRAAGGNHVLRSLSDMLRGKQGRFRQNLLGKRVDYSGRSVIVVGPKLRLDQVGLPKEMALEMFKPFVLREIIARGLSANIKGAKAVLEMRQGEVWDILEEVIKGHPVLINRAPTLHRLGIQAFYPVLIEGSAIQIHPCVCAGFGADFDGDQMAVHVPLSKKSQEEASNLMMAKENILKPASGQTAIGHNREMALGIYYATSLDETIPLLENKVFSLEDALFAYESGYLKLRQLIKVRFNGKDLETTAGRILFNKLLPEDMWFINKSVGAKDSQLIVMEVFSRFDRTEAAKLIDDMKDFGFWGVTISGISVGIFDNNIIPEKDQMIAEGDQEVAKVENNFQKGLITNEEKRVLTEEIWTRIGDEIAKKTLGTLTADNPVSVIMKSGGARATTEQIKQLSGMRGFSIDPTGRIVELPTKSNYRQGLSVFEYFTSARGARKGVTDKALKTADAGYLTRRLVDVAHDVIIRSEDCTDKTGLTLPVPLDNINSAISRFLGRKVAARVVHPKTKKVIVAEGEYLDEGLITQIFEAEVASLAIFSPLSCRTKFGLCARCYGWDLTTRKPIRLGVPVGVVAAQSIGEPGTQLTMRTFHSGGVAGGADITMGLPRVEELFEARTPKTPAPLSEIAGRVSINETEMGLKIRIKTTTKPHDEREYIVSANAQLLIEDGQLIAAGTQLVAGHLDIKEIIRAKGLKEAQRYIVDEVRKVYASQGVMINEKHFEVTVRKMSDKVRVESQGDTNLLPGEVIDRIKFEGENQGVLAKGGDPATASVAILGITRASLLTDSFLSAASFQETTTVLADAAASGKTDRLLGLKENVILGRLIPTSPERARME